MVKTWAIPERPGAWSGFFMPGRKHRKDQSVKISIITWDVPRIQSTVKTLSAFLRHPEWK